MSSDNEATSPSPSKEVIVASGNAEVTSSKQKSASPVEAVPEKDPFPPAQDDEPQTKPSPTDSRSEEGEARSDDGAEEGVQSTREENNHASSEAPPLPTEAPPGQAAVAHSDDGWEPQWDATVQNWYFYNRFTGISQWENPRLATTTTAAPGTTTPSTSAAAPPQISQPTSIAGGYNPAIHGSWDPNASYAQAYKVPDTAADEAEYQADLAMYNAEMDGSDPTAAAEGFSGEYGQTTAAFNKRTGKTQAGDQNSERHSDASKSYRQMNAYFNVDQAANSHDGRSLKAERRGKQPTRKELSMWKEKRKARKEEKRRAWLRD